MLSLPRHERSVHASDEKDAHDAACRLLSLQEGDVGAHSTRRPSVALENSLQRRFVDRLEAILGASASGVLREALLRAGRASLPKGDDELVMFVRVHLTNPIVELLGPRVFGAFVQDLEEDIDSPPASQVRETPPGGAPKRAVNLALVEPDEVERRRVTSVLVDAGFVVHRCERPAELALLDPAPHAIVLDLSESNVGVLLHALSSLGEPAPLVVVRTRRRLLEITRILHQARITGSAFARADGHDDELLSALAPLLRERLRDTRS